jgi:transposase
MDEVEMRREAGISCEPYQRAKCLSQKVVRQQRRERTALQALQVMERTTKVDQRRAAILLEDCTAAAKELEGRYLYYDTTGGDWVRSGKVIGRPFGVRHKEHKQCSLLKESKSSTLYTTPQVAMPH